MQGFSRAFLAILAWGVLLGGAPQALAAWKTVTVVLQEPDGGTRTIRGTAIAYGHYTREFTPRGTRDRLRVEKSLIFPDRDIRFPDLDSIEFELEDDATAGVRVPTIMTLTFRERRGEVVTATRNVSELRGFGQPKPVQILVTTDAGETVHLDLTPPYDEEGREDYRPVLRIGFE